MSVAATSTAHSPPFARRAAPPVRLALALVAALLFTLLPRLAATQEERTILWLPGTAIGAQITQERFEEIFHEILGSDRQNRHVIGRRGLSTLVERGAFTLPRCLQGYEPCVDPTHAIVQSIGADIVARATASADGSEISLELLDSELIPIETRVIREADPRRAVYAAIGQITDATAFMTVQSSPVSGRVFLDGRELGPAPWQGTLAIGTYEVEVRADGYYDWSQRIELRAGDNRGVRAELVRRAGEVMVRSGLPGAQVFVDDGVTGYPVNEPFELLPGQYLVELRVPGYDTQARLVTIAAGDFVDFRLDLRESAETISRREQDLLRARPLLLEASLVYSRSASNLEDASGTAHGGAASIACVATPSGCGDARTGIHHLGLDLGVAWQRGWMEIPVLGLGVRSLSLSETTAVYGLNENAEFVRFDGGREILVRLPGFGVRWLINHRLEPWARVGFGVAFESYEGRETGATREDVRFTRTNFLFEARAGVRWHFNRLVYAFGDLHVAPSINQGPATRAGASLGMGLNLPFGSASPSPERTP